MKGRLIPETRGRDRRVVWVCVWSASLCLRPESPDLLCAGGNGAFDRIFEQSSFFKKMQFVIGIESVLLSVVCSIRGVRVKWFAFQPFLTWAFSSSNLLLLLILMVSS